MATGIVIEGVTIPVEDFTKIGLAMPVILLGIANGQSAASIAASVEPSILVVIEAVASLFNPFAGPAIGIIIALARNSRPETQDEWNARAARMSGTKDQG